MRLKLRTALVVALVSLLVDAAAPSLVAAAMMAKPTHPTAPRAAHKLNAPIATAHERGARKGSKPAVVRAGKGKVSGRTETGSHKAQTRPGVRVGRATTGSRSRKDMARTEAASLRGRHAKNAARTPASVKQSTASAKRARGTSRSVLRNQARLDRAGRVHEWVNSREIPGAPARAASASDSDTKRPTLTAMPATSLDATTLDATDRSAADGQTSPARRSSGVSHPPEDDQTAPFIASPAEKPADVQTNILGVVRGDPGRPAFRSIEDQASTPVYLASLYDKRGHLVMPAPLKGSHEILLHQNQVADRDGLTRVQDDTDLLEMRKARTLVAVPENYALRVDERLPANRRYTRMWTAGFLTRLAADHYARFHSAIQVNSAVRTVDFQLKLLRTNGNAAPAAGETASPHLTGQAVDIAKKGLSLAEIAWMRAYLLPLVNDGKIDVEEEFQQACFHISVYRAFIPQAPRMTIATTHRTSVSALALAPSAQ